MVLEGIFDAVSKIVKSNARNDDDISDRLNHRYTVILLVIFTVIVSATQYVGSPIHCWSPAYFTDAHVEFADSICWVTNTYYLPDPDVLPGQKGAMKRHIAYYQWVPLILLAQALLFFIPCLFWRLLNDRSGININNLVEAAETIQNALYPERREKTIKYMIRHLDHYLEYQQGYRAGCCAHLRRFLARGLFCFRVGNRYGNYLVTLYTATKVLYVANVAGQLLLLDLLLGAGYHMYGVQVITEALSGNQLKGVVGGSVTVGAGAQRFPTVTLCDFSIRQMGTVHSHTLQCVLPINLFNEKIYAFLWFWFVGVAVAICFSIMRWSWTVGFRMKRVLYIRRHLKVMDRLDSDGRDRQLSVMFVEKYLRRDGVFVLKLVAKNSTDLVVADIVAALWDNYRRKPGVVHGEAALDARRPSAAAGGVHDDDQPADDAEKV